MRGEDKSLEKGIIEGTLPGNRKRGRPKTAWIDNVTSWTGLKLEDTIRKVDNRSVWIGERRFVEQPTHVYLENGR